MKSQGNCCFLEEAFSKGTVLLHKLILYNMQQLHFVHWCSCDFTNDPVLHCMTTVQR